MQGVGLVCEYVCVGGEGGGVGDAAGHHALSMSVNAERCSEIYDTAQTPGIKQNAKLRSAGLNQTCNTSSFPASHDIAHSVFHPHLALPATSVFTVNITVNFIC